jgi:hypothetical protein
MQKDPNVWFLAGTLGGTSTRRCAIPANKGLFLPVINILNSYVTDPQLKTDSELCAAAQSDIDDITKKDAMIDGIKVDPYRVISPIFTPNVIKDNVLSTQAGPTRAVSDGYWVFLRPLSIGRHVINIFGSCSLGKTSVGVSYDMIIV